MGTDFPNQTPENEELIKYFREKIQPRLTKGKVSSQDLVQTFESRLELNRQSPTHLKAKTAGRIVSGVSGIYFVLASIGSFILLFVEEDEGYGSVRPYVIHGIVGLFSAVVVAACLYAFGTYVEARAEQIGRDS